MKNRYILWETKMSLQNWKKNRWLLAHSSSRREIQDLFGIIDRDLQECLLEGLSSDWKLNIAYNAALKAATAALAAAGYRASTESHHHRVIMSLELTIGWTTDTVDLLDKFRKKRNISDYNRAGTVTEKEANEMFSLAEKLRSDVIKWIKKDHPEFV